MIVLVCVTAALMVLGGVNVLAALGLVLVLIWPPAAAVMLVGAVLWELVTRRRNRDPESEAAFLTTIASTVSAGSTVRDAIAGSRSSFVSEETRRLCALGRPLTEAAALLTPKMQVTGREFGVLLGLSESTGSRIAPALYQLADDAGQAEQRNRDQRVAVAQAKFSSIVVGVVPLVVAVGVLVLRGVPEPGGAIIYIPMVLGASMMAAGSVAVVVMSRRTVT